MRSIALKTTAIVALLGTTFAYAQTQDNPPVDDSHTYEESTEMAQSDSETAETDPATSETLKVDSWEQSEPVEAWPSDSEASDTEADPEAEDEDVTEPVEEEVVQPEDANSNY